MRFSEIIGNSELKLHLAQMVDKGMLGHALLFQEESGCGGLAVALALAQYVNCKQHVDGDSCGECPSCHKYQKLIHPDLHFAFPVNTSKESATSEKKKPVSDFFLQNWRELILNNPYFSEQDLYINIGIENKSGNISVYEAKQIIDKLSLRSFEGEYKTMIIWLPEKMNAEASNKLLKLLEEPPLGTLFLLVSQSPEKLLPTIISRCQIIRIQPIPTEKLSIILKKRCNISDSKASIIAKLSSGSYGKALNILSEQEETSEFKEIIEQLFEAGMGKKLYSMFPIWGNLAELGRERQKEFCIYAENYIRKIFMVANGLSEISFTSDEEMAYINSLASKINPAFYEKGLKIFDDAISSIENNVSSKLIFCNLCNRLLLSL
ncbi:MAG: DNA polymerase III subunit delta [Bacteroidales bacterium]|jgi:DNA polymerase-3 subunit delta'